jgi:hypothetical protein
MYFGIAPPLNGLIRLLFKTLQVFPLIPFSGGATLRARRWRFIHLVVSSNDHFQNIPQLKKKSGYSPWV